MKPRTQSVKDRQRQRSAVKAHTLVAVPAGTRHNFINTGTTPLKLFTIYSPPKAEA